MSRPLRDIRGLTLIEVLIALAIFGIVAAIATAGVGNVLRVQAVNEAATSAQAKLRRVTEVFTQELRSAVLGGITNDPYTSSASEISFLLLDGGAGYQVMTKSSFSASTSVSISAPGNLAAIQAALGGKQILMVNNDGDAVVMAVTSITDQGSNRYSLAHSACRNTIDFTPNTLILAVRSLGLSYDASDGVLYQRDGGGSDVPLAFDMTGLSLEYVYQEADGTPHVLTDPLKQSGQPVRNGLIGSDNVTLARVQVTVSAEEPTGRGAMLERSYTGQVELATNHSFQINRVVTCNAG